MKIKFRGMDANGIMRYGRLSQDKPNSTAYYKEYPQRICWDNSNIPVKNSTLGQYINLKDKNGKEIYKDDILITNGIDGEQAWIVNFEMSSDVMGFGLDCITGDFSSVHNNVWETGEIIGNKFENPELNKT